MYRNCIFCSARLGSNDGLEHFPVGRTLAFDGGKGRLWAVCPTCSRWNLAPLEERWEAIQDAERLFRDTSQRVQSGNIGLAKLRDGTRLIRVGSALAGEVAAWRYGDELRRRRLGALFTGARIAGGAALLWLAFSGIGIPALMGHMGTSLMLGNRRRVVVHQFRAKSLHPGEDLIVTARNLPSARLARTGDGGIGVWLRDVDVDEDGWDAAPRFATVTGLITGPDADAVLRRGMVFINARGAGAGQVNHAVELLASCGAEAFLRAAADRGEPLRNSSLPRAERLARSVALEMALHDETERRAMEGELAALEAMWREAEQIADIADRLPDVAPPHPPRLTS